MFRPRGRATRGARAPGDPPPQVHLAAVDGSRPFRVPSMPVVRSSGFAALDAVHGDESPTVLMEVRRSPAAGTYERRILLGAACAMRARHGVHCRTSGRGRTGSCPGLSSVSSRPTLAAGTQPRASPGSSARIASTTAACSSRARRKASARAASGDGCPSRRRTGLTGSSPGRRRASGS